MMISKDKLKGAPKSKLVNLGLALAILGAMQTNIDVFGQLFGPQTQGAITMLVGIAIVVLRWMTDSGLDEK